MLIFLHQKYEIELRNLFRFFEKNRNRKRSDGWHRKLKSNPGKKNFETRTFIQS